MHYTELIEASRIFRSSEDTYDWAWRRAKKIDWLKLDELTDEVIKEEVLGFLNRWSCRIPVTDELVSRIRGSFQYRKEMFPELSSFGLDTFEEDLGKKIGNSGMNLSEVMIQLFRDFTMIGDRFRDVAASKTLHMILPKLFVMWDNAIREAYNIDKSPSGYVYDFIPMMASHAREAITTFAAEREVNLEEAHRGISELCGGRTLAKVVDEYNYLRYTSGII